VGDTTQSASLELCAGRAAQSGIAATGACRLVPKVTGGITGCVTSMACGRGLTVAMVTHREAESKLESMIEQQKEENFKEQG
jgi:hypothetical protein